MVLLLYHKYCYFIKKKMFGEIYCSLYNKIMQLSTSKRVLKKGSAVLEIICEFTNKLTNSSSLHNSILQIMWKVFD